MTPRQSSVDVSWAGETPCGVEGSWARVGTLIVALGDSGLPQLMLRGPSGRHAVDLCPWTFPSGRGQARPQLWLGHPPARPRARPPAMGVG